MDATIQTPVISASLPLETRLATSGAPLFTKATASEKGRLGGLKAQAIRKAEKEAREQAKQLAALNPATNEAEARRIKVSKQIEQIDDEIENADAKSLVQLAQAKATLWKLLFPQPKASKSRRDYSSVEPVEPA